MLIPEAECLREVMRLRLGASCPACEAPSDFAPSAKRAAFACRGCGFTIFPRHGTPFAKPDLPLAEWFLAIQLAEAGQLTAARLRRALGRRDARLDQLAAKVEAMRAARGRSGSEIDWFDAATAFLGTRSGAPQIAGVPAERDERETPWQTLKTALRLPDLDSRPMIGVGAIVALALVGAGLGWLAVPAPPDEDQDLAQATAILTLAYDKPVILVSPEIAEQLYDVTDVDTQADSPLAPTIRIASSAGDKLPESAGDAPPIARPAIKLSSGLGRSLLQGDVSGTKAKAETRPELAAYTSLARELEAGGTRNPDELLAFGPMRIRRHLVEKIVRASRATDVDPVLLMAIADKESSFQTEVQAATSSASGLFQFIEKTWLGVVREFGARYGLEREAGAIAGEVTAAERARILDLRRDAYLSAVLAGEMLKRDSLRIQRKIGRPLTGGEVYLVHFLGPDGAERMIDTISRKPDTVAAELLPKPAAANRPIFYGSDPSGGAKSLSVAEVRSKFDTMISVRLDRYKSVRAPTPAPPPNRLARERTGTP